MSYSSMSPNGYQPPQHHHSLSSPAASAHLSHNHNQHPAGHASHQSHPPHQHHQPVSHTPMPVASPAATSSALPATLAWQVPSAPAPPANSNNPFVEQKSGEWPSSRTYFTMLEYKSRLLLFGGFGDSKGRYNDLHVYETTSGWRVQQTTGESPKPIYLHSASMYGGKMVVYGGNIGKDSNDMYVLDADTYAWTRVPQPPAAQPVAPPASNTNPFVTAAPVSAGSAPSPRYGHSSCINQHQLVVVGGCRQNSVYFQDSYAYNFSTAQWRRLGDVPVDLAYHSLWSYNGQVYLFGGYNGQKFSPHLYALDNATSTWLPVRVTGAVPPACCGVACALYGKHVYVFGGYTAQGHTDNLYRMDLERRVWEQLQASNKPLPRAYLQASIISGIMYIFGGYDGSKCVTDFKMLRLGPAIGGSAAAPFVRPPLPVIQPPTPSIPLSSAASAPLNQLFAGININQPSAPAANHVTPSAPPPGLISPPSTAPQHLGAVLKDGSLETQVEFVLKQFGAGKTYLERKDIEALMMNLALHTPQQPPPPPPSHPRPTLSHSLSASASSSSSASSAARFPYTASSFSTNNPAAHPRLQDIIDIGFTRTHVLHVLELMQQQGQDTRSFELVVDRCLKEQDKTSHSAHGVYQPNNGMSASELVAAQLEDNSKECTICMTDLMDCVLRDCNHFLCCMSCGQGLMEKQLPCPVCRRTIKSCMKIYWN